MSGKVHFIGAGPGDPGLLTLKGKELIERADVIIYAGSLVNKTILSFAREGSRLIDSSSLTLEQIAGEMISAAKKGMCIARVHTGDPSIYGAIAEQMELLRGENVPFDVVPGVSSVFAAAASLKMEYTIPGITQTLILTRKEGRTPVPERESIASLASHRASMAVFLSIGMIDEIVRELMEGGYPKDTPVAVAYKASWDDEKLIEATLETIVKKLKLEGIERHALILVGDAVGSCRGEPSKLYSPDFSHGFRAGKDNRKKSMAIMALTRRGWHTGMKILHAVENAELYLPAKFKKEVSDTRIIFYDYARKEIERLFQSHGKLVLIMATGIAVRIVTPFLKSKWEDPAVVTMDDGGRNIISFLSGHWGGANDLTLKLSQILGGNPVITTESDVMGFPSVDNIIKAFTGGEIPGDAAVLKNIQTAILEDEDVGFYPKEISFFSDMKGHPNLHFFDSIEELLCSGCSAGLIVSHDPLKVTTGSDKYLRVTPKNLVVGIGCHRNISSEEIKREINKVFHDINLSVSSIALICSINKKKDENGLVCYANSLNIPLNFYKPEDINSVKQFSPESIHAIKNMGVHGVAEPCAVLGSEGGKLIMNKIKLQNMTIAVAALPLIRMIEESEESFIE